MSGSSMFAKKAPKGGFHQSDLNVHQAKMKQVLSELVTSDKGIGRNEFPGWFLRKVELEDRKLEEHKRPVITYALGIRNPSIRTASERWVDTKLYISVWESDRKKWDSFHYGCGAYEWVRDWYTEGTGRDIGKFM